MFRSFKVKTMCRLLQKFSIKTCRCKAQTELKENQEWSS
ncbi:predicted protein [Botrytis cinerea T4]|uniref:Uncharacterized protein n=1 Tax=Botryotinia fuckeliana (strain T4) TaxID=999810 RepID=G2Y6T0_BOTF4|nr:predicted protein [Botrytis cinerea T4]